MKLFIYIPTYNRPIALRKLLDSLVLQSKDYESNLRILINDNNSDNNVNDNIINCSVNNTCRVNVTGFHKDVKHTVLKPLVDGKNIIQVNKQQEVAKLLYDVSNVFIANADGWESDFLYMYMLYNFDFKIGEGSRKHFLNDLRQISTDSIARRDIPYYAKDVDKASAHYLKGDLVILPASIFDANPSNSSKNSEAFVPIPSTTIPHCNGYNFMYGFENANCKLTLKYGNGNTSYTVCSSNRYRKSL